MNNEFRVRSNASRKCDLTFIVCVLFHDSFSLKAYIMMLFGVPNLGLIFSFDKAAPKLWNDLLLEIRQTSSLFVFKSRLKTHLFALAFDTLWDAGLSSVLLFYLFYMFNFITYYFIVFYSYLSFVQRFGPTWFLKCFMNKVELSYFKLLLFLWFQISGSRPQLSCQDQLHGKKTAPQKQRTSRHPRQMSQGKIVRCVYMHFGTYIYIRAVLINE